MKADANLATTNLVLFFRLVCCYKWIKLTPIWVKSENIQKPKQGEKERDKTKGEERKNNQIKCIQKEP